MRTSGSPAGPAPTRRRAAPLGDAGRRAAGRELAVAVGLCLLAGVLLLLAAGRPWVQTAGSPGLGATAARVVSGRELTGVPGAVGLVALAGVAALVAARGVGRVLLGILLVAAGASAAYVSAVTVGGEAIRSVSGPAGGNVSTTVWPWVAVAGGVVLLLAGGVAVVRGRRWAALSRRYDAPSARRRPRDPAVAAWEALDAGDDPTLHRGNTA